MYKPQGLQLQKAVTNCSPEFTRGLLYTAFSRVKKAMELQVRNFSPFSVSDRSNETVKINSHLQQSKLLDGCVCHNPVVLDAIDSIPLPKIDDETLCGMVRLFDNSVNADDEKWSTSWNS